MRKIRYWLLNTFCKSELLEIHDRYSRIVKQIEYDTNKKKQDIDIVHRILSEKNISRMEDAKLVSDLLAVIVKNKIESNSFEQSKKIYAQYDDEFEDSKIIEKQFKYTLDLFCKIYEENFSETSFSKLPLFYSTFLALYHMNYQISIFELQGINITEKDLPKIKTALDDIDVIVSEPEGLRKEDEDFVLTLKKNTTTPDVRIRRCKYIIQKLVNSLRV